MANITLGVTGTYGQFSVESAFGSDGQPLSADTLAAFVSMVNGAGNGVQIVYNQKSGSGDGTGATGGSSAAAGTPDPDDDGSQDPDQSSTEKALDAADIRAIVRQKTTPYGTGGQAFNVETEAELQELYDEITAGADQTVPGGPKYPEGFKIQSDGTRIGLRTQSETGGNTIDVFPKGSKNGYKIHIKP
ncbi:hypothetical protein FHT86_005577 [Rhizobium sp. BK313]|uniref:hypothetical protein n=1 Tax=Rhizobium sp. BK313 TaxID=2587081 RepID=UPI00105DC81B|nr:hypothetical protein [Rhizobium sp. BK313]MBB3457259.1 hypothetical protein [Rhizobium sp. BK313]